MIIRCMLIVIGAASVLAIGHFAEANSTSQPKKPIPRFNITMRRAHDTASVEGDSDRTVCAIHCPFGISQAVIERKEESWPKALVLKLHLQGLSNFRASNGKVILNAAMDLQDGKSTVRLWKDNDENAPLDHHSALWMDIHVVGSDGKPARAIPVRDGFFEMTLPRALFQDNPRSITVSWIDWYR